MKNEELYIKSRMGNTNPFVVPDGYFDNLAAEVMNKLPEQPHRGLLLKMRPWMLAAACFVAVLFTATLYLMVPESANQSQMASTSIVSNDSYFDDAADYVMADNIDIYACLASDY
jgi:hypothetical protein